MHLPTLIYTFRNSATLVYYLTGSEEKRFVTDFVADGNEVHDDDYRLRQRKCKGSIMLPINNDSDFIVIYNFMLLSSYLH